MTACRREGQNECRARVARRSRRKGIVHGYQDRSRKGASRLISTISELEHGISTAPCVFESIHMAAEFEFEGLIPL